MYDFDWMDADRYKNYWRCELKHEFKARLQKTGYNDSDLL